MICGPLSVCPDLPEVPTNLAMNLLRLERRVYPGFGQVGNPICYVTQPS